jgi:hypothetical protein
MAKGKFHVGDKVKVVGMSNIIFAPGVKDELGTEGLFKSMIGKGYTVKGFDEYGYLELYPKRTSWVWVEPEFLRVRRKKAGCTNARLRDICLLPGPKLGSMLSRLQCV